MSTVWLRGLTAVLSTLGLLVLGASAASANCDWYVKTALEQQQRNLKLKCGFSGDGCGDVLDCGPCPLPVPK